MINLGVIKMIDKKELEEIINKKVVMKKIEPIKRKRKVVSEDGYIVPMMIAMYGTSLLKMGLDFYEKNFSKFARECSGLGENEKGICMLRAKKRAMEGQIAFLEKSIANCAKAKDAAICEQKLRTKITSLKSDAGYLSDRLSKYGVSPHAQ